MTFTDFLTLVDQRVSFDGASVGAVGSATREAIVKAAVYEFSRLSRYFQARGERFDGQAAGARALSTHTGTSYSPRVWEAKRVQMGATTLRVTTLGELEGLSDLAPLANAAPNRWAQERAEWILLNCPLDSASAAEQWYVWGWQDHPVLSAGSTVMAFSEPDLGGVADWAAVQLMTGVVLDAGEQARYATYRERANDAIRRIRAERLKADSRLS